MSILACWLARPEGVVGRAYYTAHRKLAEKRLPSIALSPTIVEAFAEGLLAERGYDTELLALAIADTPPAHWSLADLDAQLENTRRRTP